MKRILTAITLSLTSFVTLSHNLTIGENLPQVTIADKGYVELVEGEFDYRQWSTGELKNKVIVVQHIAGRTSAKELNEPMIDALKQADFPFEKYNTATLVNLDDAIWGTGAIVASQLKSNKEEFPDAIFVVDEEGDLRNQWGLTEESSAIILLDPAGKILFVKDGEMNPTEINNVIGLINANI
ncbi:YtfJ family protein [Moritella sp. Urea-trap-13]|uniref:YtfJ family protein n=1 Tax=Moritella sp. Urea-trap-13 TaxID=2058327 RepID=UPI000C33C3F8|nr:YtfJ family protein [Moritella sp. Urea-trap-13]PKH07270.1 YtfJ family protein [Moritella sp. Urea-trap-13]